MDITEKRFRISESFFCFGLIFLQEDRFVFCAFILVLKIHFSAHLLANYYTPNKLIYDNTAIINSSGFYAFM